MSVSASEVLNMRPYDAYAPLPIVLDTIRNGKSRGKGSS